MGKVAAPDPVDAAIAAAEAKPATIQMAQEQVTISSTGRPVILVFPPDLTDSELAELTGWMLTGLRAKIAANRTPSPLSRLSAPDGRPLVS